MFDRHTSRIVRQYRSIDTLPATFSGDYFDNMAAYALSWVSQYARTYASPVGTLFANAVQVHENHYALNYNISVEYGPVDRQAGAYQIQVDTSGGTVHVTHGEVIGAHGANAPQGIVGETEPIGKDGDQIAGIDIPVSQPKINVSFRHPEGILNRDYIKAIGELVGFPNSDTFLGYAKGEVMYLGGPFTETDAEASASYSFAISYNRTNFDVGKITISKKYGWDILEPRFKDHILDDKPVKPVDYFLTIRPAARQWKAYVSAFGWGG